MGPVGNPNYNVSASAQGYISLKLYELLRIILKNKTCSQSAELIQYFAELKETSIGPSISQIQTIATRVALDTQGNLILRDNGKIVIPYEHFTNAVMLKHVKGPHGMHLTPEGTLRSVMETFTVGKECFGMEKEFIIEIVQNCPHLGCRYYKNHLELSHKFGALTSNQVFDTESPATILFRSTFSHSTDLQPPINASVMSVQLGSNNDTSDLRGPGSNINPQRSPSRPSLNTLHRHVSIDKKINNKYMDALIPVTSMSDCLKLNDFLRVSGESTETLNDLIMYDNFQGLGMSTDHAALQTGHWPMDTDPRSSTSIDGNQDKIIRAFSEVMKNMARMKTCVRPAMCKPYGKQSESLQKTLIDTIQLVQTLRNFLPPPPISISSWKNEDKHRADHISSSYMPIL